MKCPFCDENTVIAGFGTCADCACDPELEEHLYAASRRALAMGLTTERFLDLADAALDCTWKPCPAEKERVQ